MPTQPHKDSANSTRQSIDRKKGSATNSGLEKVAVQCSADAFVVNQSLVLHINIGDEIATFAKPQTLVATLK